MPVWRNLRAILKKAQMASSENDFATIVKSGSLVFDCVNRKLETFISTKSLIEMYRYT